MCPSKKNQLTPKNCYFGLTIWRILSDTWGTATPDGTIITSLGPICFLTQSDRGFARGKHFHGKEVGGSIFLPTFCRKIENTFFHIFLYHKIESSQNLFSGPDLYSSVASSLNHYYSANISACDQPQKKPHKKTNQTKNEVIDTVESSV